MAPELDERDFSEELFAHTRMSFWDHIEELRQHLWRAIIGFVIVMVVSLLFGKPVLAFIAHPVEVELQRFYDRRVERLVQEGKDHPEDPKNAPPPFTQLTFDARQLRALLQGMPLEEINRAPRPLTEAEMNEARQKNGGEAPPNTRLIQNGDLVHLWYRFERPTDTVAGLSKSIRFISRPATLATMNITEGFIVYFKLSMFAGLVIGSPWIFYQLWSFVAAGLYPSEKRYVYKYLPFCLGLFLAGVFLCQFLVIPTAVRYLLEFNEWLGLEPELRLNEWLTFALMFPLMFGLSFQTPLVMYALYKVGLVEVETYTNNRRIAMFGLALMSMLLAAAPDAFSMLAMMVPLWGLYEVGILMCKLSPRERFEGEEAAEAPIGI